MRYHFLPTKMPELSGFNAQARHFLVQCARRAMFEHRPWLRWTTLVFTILGAIGGVYLASLLPSSLVTKTSDSPVVRGIAPILVIGAVAMTAFYFGLCLQSLWLRPYLRKLIE